MNVDLKVVRYGENLDSMHGMMVYTFGNFKLLPRNNEDMVNYSDPIDTGDGTDGLREIANLDLRMYPNPTEGELYILPKTDRNYRMNVEILDLQGKVIQNQFINTNSINTINLNQVKSGMYLIKLVNTENGKFTTRKVLVN